MTKDIRINHMTNSKMKVKAIMIYINTSRKPAASKHVTSRGELDHLDWIRLEGGLESDPKEPVQHERDKGAGGTTLTAPLRYRGPRMKVTDWEGCHVPLASPSCHGLNRDRKCSSWSEGNSKAQAGGAPGGGMCISWSVGSGQVWFPLHPSFGVRCGSVERSNPDLDPAWVVLMSHGPLTSPKQTPNLKHHNRFHGNPKTNL
ncbi:hypothetical protein BDK51DRAFT_27455 [Blyttiomyces helicus]|uniref:Uncharacterized protein n=1 Tax=Blyttiomyces helicus TaxID=388810 RepID=A0A4P9WNS4_9FUNG|nr:hypothetical protein BDK51DRAFT_27455 [Blyttiomyces helicus]|eukprot:RKO94644.1 hypothetical protein BDK51DRAFT_27455 [Blyttiomyces helicus]